MPRQLGKLSADILLDISVRVLLFAASNIFDGARPFTRVIRPEESWLYSYPMTDSYVPGWCLWCAVFGIAGVCILLSYFRSEDISDTYATILSVSLAISLNGTLTNLLKVIVGRPRPDFLQRCYGTVSPALSNFSSPCVGAEDVVFEGRKSFPSGHSSYAFTVAVFLSLYLSDRLFISEHSASGGSRTCGQLVILSPLLAAALVAASRTCDYHHHWQDVVVGSLLGSWAAIFSYGQYFRRSLGIADWLTGRGNLSRRVSPMVSPAEPRSPDHSPIRLMM